MDPEDQSQDSAPVDSTQSDISGLLENSSGGAPEQAQPTDEFHGHPAWKPFEDVLGPIAYRSIEPELRKMNSAFEAKIASQNKSLEPWKGFIDEGVDPGELQFSRQLLQEINTDPMAFRGKLEAYLQNSGLLPAEAAAVADQIEEELTDEDEDPRIKSLQQQLAELQAAQGQTAQAQQQWLAEQEFQRNVATEEQKLTSEVEALKAKGVDDFTVSQLLDRAELLYHRTGKPTPLTQIYEEWNTTVRGTILAQPRPVDSAPRLPSSSGGAPSNGGVDLSTATREQSRDTLAALLAANRE